jgi:hypothetical protein
MNGFIGSTRAQQGGDSDFPPLPRRTSRSRAGFALEATLLVMVLLGVLAAITVTGVITTTRTAAIDYRGTQVTYAAEAGADAIMAQLEVAMEDGVLSDDDFASLEAPTLEGFSFSHVDVQRVGSGHVRPITTGSFAGLFALNQPVDIRITAHDTLQNSSSVIVTVNAQSIPLFQFGVFYEDDLEIHNGPPMMFGGWVHTNGNLYLSSANSFFRSQLSTPDSVFWQRKNSAERLNGVHVTNAGGIDVPLRFDSRSIPDPEAFRARSALDFDGRVMTGAHGVSPLRLPLPSGMPPIELVRPRAGADNAQMREVKFAWKADMHILVPINSLNGACANIVIERPGALEVPSNAACNAIFSGHANRFLDGREDLSPDLFQIDIAALRTWIAGSPAARATRVIYVTFQGPFNTNPANDFPAVRVVNGSQLSGPLTIATDRPLYVQGDFNTIGWWPASLLGDAITFLSNAWNDGNQTTLASGRYTSGGNNASALTSVYAAIAAGHSATPCDNQRIGCSSPPYGGGLENFPRFLENFGAARTMFYRGSLVSLFQSEHARLRNWNWRNYYSPPRRDWEFDLRYQDPSNLPPGTPSVGSVIQTAFRPLY